MNPKKITLLVEESNFQDIRIDRWLTQLDLGCSRSYIVDMFKKNGIQVNQKFVLPSYKVKLKDIIQIQIPEKIDSELIPLNSNLNIVFQDAHIAIINKPAGLVVHPAPGHAQDTLVNILIHHFKDLSMKNEGRPGIVHRIDKDTSGLLVIAKNDYAHEFLSQQFKNKTTHRIYYALVQGLPKAQKGIIQSYLQRSNNDRKKYSSYKLNNKIVRVRTDDQINAKWAVTEYEVISSCKNMSLVKLKLQTGRTHQIRVHMSELGHPIVGDLTYGFPGNRYNEMQLKRFFLHAAELGFVHPAEKVLMSWSVQWPDEDILLLKQWGFYV